MPQPMKVWRENARRKLIIALGSKCSNPGCGKTEAEVQLIFAHITPLTEEQEEHRAKIGMNSRMVLYRKEHAEGLLKLLCQSCNIKEAREQGRSYTPTESHPNRPF